MRKAAERQRELTLRSNYDSMYAAWQSRLERFEKLPKRKDRQARRRELYEKQFAELRKQRQDAEQLERLTSRQPEQLLNSLGNSSASESEAVRLVSELNEKLVRSHLPIRLPFHLAFQLYFSVSFVRLLKVHLRL